MEEVTRKGRGRPRKNLAVPNAVAEGEDASAIHDGNGTTRGVGAEPSSNGSGTAQSWLDFSHRITALTNENIGVRVAFHPDPLHDLIQGNWNVPVRRASIPSYMMGDGKVYEI